MVGISVHFVPTVVNDVTLCGWRMQWAGGIEPTPSHSFL
jgi:hypothetical protein